MMKSEEDIPSLMMLGQAEAPDGAWSSGTAESLEGEGSKPRGLFFNYQGVSLNFRLSKFSLDLDRACDRPSCQDSGFEVTDPLYPRCHCQEGGGGTAEESCGESEGYGSVSIRRELKNRVEGLGQGARQLRK